MINRISGNAAFAYGNTNKEAGAKSRQPERSDSDPFTQIARERVAKGEGTDRLIPAQPSARTQAPRSSPADSTAAIAQLQSNNDLRNNDQSRAAGTSPGGADQPRGQQLFRANAQTVRVAADETGSLLDVTG